jgi:hypothetical protein
MLQSWPPTQQTVQPLSPRSGKASSSTRGIHDHRHHPVPTISSTSSSSNNVQTNNNHPTTASSASTLNNWTDSNSNSKSNLHSESTGMSSNQVLKRGDACLFCRRRKLKCDAGQSLPQLTFDPAPACACRSSSLILILIPPHRSSPPPSSPSKNRTWPPQSNPVAGNAHA